MPSSLSVKRIACTTPVLKRLDQLDRKCFPQDEPWDAKERAYWWLARWDGVEAGFAGILEVDGGQTGFLCRAGVLPEFRGNGIQRRLIQERVRFARSHGYKQVITYTSIDNTASSNNLIACGFVLYQPEYSFVGPNYNYWYLTL